MIEILLVLIYGIVACLPFYFFLILKVLIGKKRMFFYYLGVIVQVLSYVGHLAGRARDPERYQITTEWVFSIIWFVVVAVGSYFLFKREKDH